MPRPTPLLLGLALLAALPAADWPEWRGAGRDGVWREQGVLERFPADGLRYLWRTPIGAGYAGPSVAAGRVFVTDFEAEGETRRGTERLLALDADTGRLLWQAAWPADYAGLDYPSGPRATPTVDGELVYALGAAGELRCLRVGNGETVWRTDFRDSAELPPGFATAPIVVDDLLIASPPPGPTARSWPLTSDRDARFGARCRRRAPAPVIRSRA